MAISERVASPGAPNVVIDVRMLHHAGIGTYVRNVVPRVIRARPSWRFTLLTSGETPEWVSGTRTTAVACASSIYTIREQVELPRKTPRAADLFWSPHYNVPVLSRVPLVVTVHDVCHLAMPSLYGGAVRQAYAKFVFGSVCHRAREILFDSDFTRAEFSRYVGEPRRSTTVPLGVDPVWRSAPSSARRYERPYVLFIGSVKPHKNLVALLRAFDGAGDELAAYDLLIVGDLEKQRTIDSEAIALARSLGARARLVSGASDADVRSYVAHAAALVLPSLYEGFGLPAIEAMAAGCPCLVSNAASLPEVCGDGALYCDPTNATDIARQLVRLLTDTDLRGQLVAAGRTRAATYDWNVTAERTASVLDRALGVREAGA